MSKISTAVLPFAVLGSVAAFAGDDKAPNFTPRQLAHCVMARAKASPNESYKVAFKVCREQLDSAANEEKPQTVMIRENSRS